MLLSKCAAVTKMELTYCTALGNAVLILLT